MTRLVIGKPFNVKEMVGPTPSQDKLNQVAKQLNYISKRCVKAGNYEDFIQKRSYLNHER